MLADLLKRKEVTPAEANPVVVYYNLSDLLGYPVRYEDETRPFARLYDIAGSSATAYPLAVALSVVPRAGKEHITVPWVAVKSVGASELVVTRTSAPIPPVDFWARRDVLDDQVVDVSGAKVLRVNDVHLIYSANKLIFGHVEIGLRGILRRLRFERSVNFLTRWLFDYSIKDSFVTWRHLQVISPGGVPGGLKVQKLSEKLADIHPAELADILEQLGTNDRQAIFNAMPVEAAANALEEVTPEFQRTLVSQGEPGRVADILEEMLPDEAADVLRDLGPDAQHIISRMEGEAATEVQTLLSHRETTAGGVMDLNCVDARPEDTVATVWARLPHLAETIEAYSLIYVLDQRRELKGVLSLRELLRAPQEASLDSLMTRDPVAVTPETPLDTVARDFAKYGFRALPVVDRERILQGVVRYESIVAYLADT